MPSLRLDLDKPTYGALVERAVTELRPVVWQAEVELKRALGVSPAVNGHEPVPEPRDTLGATLAGQGAADAAARQRRLGAFATAACDFAEGCVANLSVFYRHRLAMLADHYSTARVKPAELWAFATDAEAATAPLVSVLLADLAALDADAWARCCRWFRNPRRGREGRPRRGRLAPLAPARPRQPRPGPGSADPPGQGDARPSLDRDDGEVPARSALGQLGHVPAGLRGGSNYVPMAGSRESG
jgi:hypothetical protein